MHKHLPRRWDERGAWYFVTVVTHERHPYFASSDGCRILVEACRSVRRIHLYRLGALVIMPDHWHALMRPREPEVIESIIGSIKQRTFHASRPKNNTACPDGASTDGSAAFHGGANGVIRWQPRFMDHRIRDVADYFQHLEYMRLNPFKHQLVAQEKDPWPWWFAHERPFG